MLKLPITYTDFNGNKVTEIFHFHLSKPELTAMQYDADGGLDEALKRIVETEDKRRLVAEFQRFILAAYGVKSDDGKRFIKSPELRDEFSQTAAYEELWFKLGSDADYAAKFFAGIMPEDMKPQQDKPTSIPTLSPPPPPAA